mmetsp:Transcript_10984/g.24197  ORF Transcript_10984/g.24197 Transcript_10984/m.24197 type:complete len:90 (-) Transcript_10984:132-401(-)
MLRVIQYKGGPIQAKHHSLWCGEKTLEEGMHFVPTSSATASTSCGMKRATMLTSPQPPSEKEQRSCLEMLKKKRDQRCQTGSGCSHPSK